MPDRFAYYDPLPRFDRDEDGQPMYEAVEAETKVSSVGFASAAEFGQIVGVSYGLDRREIPYRATDDTVFGTSSEAQAECDRRNGGPV